MKLSQLKPNPKNPRKISDKKLEMLKKSLNEFGDLSGIVFNKQTGHLVGGHQRLKAIPKDAEIVMDTETHGHVKIGNERFQYREVSWDETKEKAANIAANKHGGEWDFGLLTEWLLELDHMNIDMDLTGFDGVEIEKIMAPVNSTALPDLPSGDKPPFQQKTFTLSNDQCDQVDHALSIAKGLGEFGDTGNENSNGNALARVCELFVGSHGNG